MARGKEVADPSGPSRPAVQEYCIVPPDGGWGWVVVAAAFYINTVIDGVIFTYGIFINQIMDSYKVKMVQVSLIGSLMFGFHLIAGPVCILLTKLIGVRPTVSIGGLITSFALFCAYFNPPFSVLTTMFGFVAGVGMCFAYLPSITITTLYFKKFRLLAVSIVVCGTGLGTVVFSLTGNLLLKSMSWQMAHLILAFCSFLITLFGLTFRPLEPIKIVTHERTTSVSSIGTLWDDDDAEEKNIVVLTDRPKSATSTMGVNEATEIMYEQMIHEVQVHRFVFRDDLAHWCRKTFPCCRKTAQRISVDPETAHQLISEKRRKKWSRKHFGPQTEENRWQLAKKSFVSMDWTFLKSLDFILYTVSGALASAAMMIIYTFEIKRAEWNGYSPDESDPLLTVLGASNLVWRLMLGMVASLPKVNYHALNVVCHVVGGGATAMSAFSTHIAAFYVHCLFLGLGLAAFAVFRPVVLLELVGTERLGDALGICMVFYGIFGTLGPPAAGWILDLTNDNYNVIYWVAGGMFMVSGVLMIFITGTRPKLIYRRDGGSSDRSAHS